MKNLLVPFTTSRAFGGKVFIVDAADNSHGISFPESAAAICAAVNSHAELVAALVDIQKCEGVLRATVRYRVGDEIGLWTALNRINDIIARLEVAQ